MSYRKPFRIRAPDFRRVDYQFTYSTEESARAAFDSLRNKRYTLVDGEYILPVGHRIHAVNEVLDGRVLGFTGQLKAAALLASDPQIQSMELEIAGQEGSMTTKSEAY